MAFTVVQDIQLPNEVLPLLPLAGSAAGVPPMAAADPVRDQPIRSSRGLCFDALLELIGCLICVSQKLLAQLIDRGAQLDWREASVVSQQLLELGLDFLGAGWVLRAMAAASRMR
jgi:hypothetical protein